MIIWHPLFPIPGFRWSTIWSRRSTSGNGATPSSSERSSGCASPSCCGTPSLNPAAGSSNQQPRPQRKWSVSSLLNRPSEDNASYFFWLAEGSTNGFQPSIWNWIDCSSSKAFWIILSSAFASVMIGLVSLLAKVWEKKKLWIVIN